MLILSIESSCDDTSVALLNCSKQGCFVIKEITASQIDIHKKYGGVVPEIAGRAHAEKIVPLIEEVLKGQTQPETIAVASGPGLITGLIVGVEAVRTLSYAWNIPLVNVNHIEGHIYSTLINNKQKIKLPAIALVVSGGHTEIILIKKDKKYKLLGKTKDDAAGECFDKTAKLLNLPYPGGPKISILAEKGKTDAIKFPRPMLEQDSFNFSFSGLKTSALYWLQKNKLNKKITKEDFAASFEQAIIDVLVGKTINAVKKYHPQTVILGGGVSGNQKLREALKQEILTTDKKINFLMPEKKYSMDNAVMIGVAGYQHALKKDFTAWQKLKADPNWRLAN
jgi:N6-L-threonylcarbamoyladenine synthase